MTSWDLQSTSAQENDGWTLPFDILPGIMATAQRPTISALMKTCRVLYTEGPKHLLRGGVELSSTRQVILFVTFMLVEEDVSRFTHFRKLVLSIRSVPYPPERELLYYLEYLLTHPSLSLETLAIPYAEYLLACSGPAFCRAIRSLTTVKHLVTLRTGREGGTFINAFPSTFESVTIGVDQNSPFHISALLPFSVTLHTLLIKPETYVSALSLLWNVGVNAFPNVRTFGIVCYTPVPHLLDTPAFFCAFPNIAHLQLIPTKLDVATGYELSPGLEIARASRVREDLHNQRMQYRHGGVTSLTSLTECSGELLDVFALALDRPLSKLSLWQRIEPAVVRVLRTVLEDTRPRHLRLSVARNATAQVFNVLRGLGNTESSGPRRVDIDIAVHSNHRALRGEVTMEQLISAFFPLPAGLVELNVLFVIPALFQPHPDPLLSEAGLAAFVQMVSAAVPSLAFTCRATYGEFCFEWPDLGQGDYREQVAYDFDYDDADEDAAADFSAELDPAFMDNPELETVGDGDVVDLGLGELLTLNDGD